jgi:hypothetical protein
VAKHTKQLPLTIIIYPYGFRKFDWDRFELSFLEEKSEVIVCELIEFLTPLYAKAYQERLENARIIRFASLKRWFRFFKGLTGDSLRKVTIFNFVRVVGPKEFVVNLILKRSGYTIVDFYQPGVPDFSVENRSLQGRVVSRLKKILSRYAWKSLYKRSNYAVFQYLASIFDLHPNYRLVAGKYYVNNQEKLCKEKNISIIFGSSWDYSRMSRVSSSHNSAQKYAVLLDGAGPMFGSDSLISGAKVYFTSDVWYPALINFMNKLENRFNCKIIIAAHPKTKHERYPSYFGGREVVHQRALELVKNAEFVITRKSTAISYAVEFKKPCIFIYSDQLLQDSRYMEDIYGTANALGCVPINIDKDFNDDDIKSLMNVNVSAYTSFKMNYLTSVGSDIQNYEILLKEVV